MQVRKLAANMVWVAARLDRVPAIALHSQAASLVKQIYTN
jgi:hypothetical protein